MKTPALHSVQENLERLGDEVMTTREVADHFRVASSTASRWLSEGRIRGIKVGGQWRVLRREVQAFQDRMDQEPTP